LQHRLLGRRSSALDRDQQDRIQGRGEGGGNPYRRDVKVVRVERFFAVPRIFEAAGERKVALRKLDPS